MSSAIRPRLKPRCCSCRRKRIKCDYVRPSCGMCVRSRIQCDYDDEWRFIPQYSDASTTETYAGHGKKAVVRGRHGKTATIIQVPAEAHHNVQMLFDKFLTYFIPDTPSDQLQMEAGWVFRLPDIRRNFKPLDTIVNAFALMLTARDNHDEAVHMHAMKLYVQALSEVNAYHSKGPGIRTHWHEAALTSIFLQYYENTDGIKNAVKGQHLSGISVLMQMGGMESVQDPRFQSTFLITRNSMIIQSIIGNFIHLSTYRWCFYPWGEVFNDLFHKCLDIAVFIPGYREFAMKLRENPNKQAVKKFRLVHEHLNQRLTRWYEEEVESRLDTFCRFEDGSKFNDDDELVQSVGYDIRFSNIRHCLAITLYWITRLELFASWEDVYKCARTSAGRDSQAEYDAQLRNARAMCDNLCFSVRFLLRPDQAILGTHSATLPTWSVNRFCAKHGMAQRREWLYGLVGAVEAGNFNISFLTKVLK